MNRLLTSLFIGSTLVCHAQTNVFDIGIEGGGGIATLRGNEFILNFHDPRTGYTVGIFGQFNFKKLISLRTGAYLERKGSSFNVLFTDNTGQPIRTVKGKEHFEFITIPLLVRATFGNRLNYFVNAGGYIGLLQKQVEHTNGFENYPETNREQTSNFNSSEFGLSLGVGLSYKFKVPVSLSLEVRDNLGLTDTSKIPVISNGTIKTNAVNILIGVSYKLGQRSA